MASMNLSREQQNELLFVGFNQDNGAPHERRLLDGLSAPFRVNVR